jgi:hypothetical protein
LDGQEKREDASGNLLFKKDGRSENTMYRHRHLDGAGMDVVALDEPRMDGFGSGAMLGPAFLDEKATDLKPLDLEEDRVGGA